MNVLRNNTQRVKSIIHGVQAFVIFIAWAITIAVFTQTGTSGGATKYFFALCWFSIPALVYLAAVPTFSRVKRFANPFAFAVLDALFTILWLAAFAAVAAWTNQGIAKGADNNEKDDKDKEQDDKKDTKDNKKGCDNFGYGSPAKCKLSQTTVGFGVLICLLFAVTTAISAYMVVYYRKNGAMPGGDTGGHVPVDEQTKYAFSSNPHDEFDADEELAGSHHNEGRAPHGDEEDDYEVLHPHPENEGSGPYDAPPSPHQPYGPNSIGMDNDTSYHGASSLSSSHPQSDPFRNPSPNPSYHSRQHSVGDPFRDEMDHGDYPSGSRVQIPDHNDYR